jgi:hypothetical protein
LAQRYHRLREAAFHKSKPARVDLTPAPIPLSRERRLTDLPPPPHTREEAVTEREQSSPESVFADRDVEEAPEEATLVQPLARRPSEAPPASERRVYTMMRPPPPPDPLPRIMPSTLPPPVALATVPPPPPPPAAVPSIWRPMLATAAMSATIGAIVSVGIWAVRTPAPAPKANAAALVAPVKAEPVVTNTVGPCPIPGAVTESGSTSNSSALVASTPASMSHSSQSQLPHEVSLEALPVETKSSRASTNAAPVLRAPAAPVTRAVRVAAPERAVAARPAPAPVARAERHAHKAADDHKSTDDSESDDDSASAAPPPPPSPPPAPTAGPDRAAIAKAVNKAAASASTCDASPQSGRAQITFAPSGNVQSVQLIQPFSDNGVNGCVLRALGRAHVPPFAGEPVIVRKALSW